VSTQEPEVGGKEPRGSALRELAEDASGFGVAELKLTRDLVLRPGRVMDAYDAEGSTAGGLYPKPFRYYLTINGVYLLLMALLGGVEQLMTAFPVEDLAELDQWFSLVMVPVTTLVFVPPIFLLIRRWSPAGDRQDLRQTFTFLNAWTLYNVPLGLIPLIRPDLLLWASAAGILVWPLLYAVMGRGRWWRTRKGAWIKGVVLLFVALVVMIPASIVAWVAALAGAMLAP
jgi:hypothetical protein